MEKLVGDGGIVGRVGALDEAFPAAVGVVEHAHDAHDGEAATGLLGAGLGIFKLVGCGVIEFERAAVDGFDDVSLIGILRADAGVEMGVDLGLDGMQEFDFQSSAALAVTAGILAGTGQPGLVTPALDQTNGL